MLDFSCLADLDHWLAKHE
ncbi:MAG: hypothetical protein KME35_03460 [Aphanocapsa sp. GSE-SYN-MK-11-07L]|nr:hypothetical protein [Aphanocapsa sp. GSE-SYN-MK-11-07L]